MFSIYTSAFNLIEGEFDCSALRKFVDFVGADGEVVVALNKSSDGSEHALKGFAAQFDNLKVVDCDIPYTDPDLDGKVKNVALQATSQRFKIGLDLDEYIPLWQKPLWTSFAYCLEWAPCKAFFIPSVDLYGSKDRVSKISEKWYLHKEGCFRGTVNFARRGDGTHDIMKSDSCELIDSNGNLIQTDSVVPMHNTLEKRIAQLEAGNDPFVVHTGYLDLARRAKLNEKFWSRHWAVENGSEVYIPTELAEFDKKTLPHKLNLE